LAFSEMVLEGTFGVNRKSICIEISAAKVFATCCGVNLAFAWFWGFWGVFLRGVVTFSRNGAEEVLSV
jgi:hypothetical protein